jgi:hypothetical protein
VTTTGRPSELSSTRFLIFRGAGAPSNRQRYSATETKGGPEDDESNRKAKWKKCNAVTKINLIAPNRMVPITLCRFDLNGKLTLSLEDIDKTPFVAVSHVWGDAEWKHVPDLGRNIPVSPQKFEFISKDLPDLVKGYHFWMDILAVDQSSDEARVGVVGQIPQIYRKAKFTIVIREEGGICSDCFDAMEELYVSEDGSDPPEETAYFRAAMNNFTALDEHMRGSHSQGIQELWMERNWPLQELLLSNTVEFAVCKEVSKETPGRSRRWESMPSTSAFDTIKARTTLMDLASLAETWVGLSAREPDSPRRIQEINLIEDFLEALRENGRVTRPSTQEWNPSLFHQLSRSSNSTRQSGKSRDYVLAVLPQFAWYQLPTNVKSMGFGPVYQDAILQIGEKYCGNPQQEELPSGNSKIRTKITEGLLCGLSVDHRSSFQPSSDVPNPECLGDVCKLMHFVEDAGTRHISLEVDQLLLQPIDVECSIAHILGLVADTFWFTHLDVKAEWLYQFAMWRDDMPRLATRLMNLGIRNSSDVSSEPSSPTRGMRHLSVTEVIIEVGRLVNVSGDSMQNTMLALSTFLIGNNPDMRSQAILRESSSLSQDWTKAINLCERADSPAFRELLLTTTAALCCGFGMNAVSWLSEKLKVYTLMGHNVKTGDLLQTLVFAAKDLDVDDLDGVQAFTGDIEPYVAVGGAEGPSSRRVIGLAPKPGNWNPNPCRPDEV